MKLHDKQLSLLRHLTLFNLLSYEDCLEMLKTETVTDRTALSYAFRPLTKNQYVSKRKDGCVSILAKGRELFAELKPLISVGGGETERKRVMAVSRMAALMERNGIPSTVQLPKSGEPCFIPSACWRVIAPGILSTTRFVGMLAGHGQRLAVYDIGDGRMDWQVRAEGSLFYTKYGSTKTSATGMLLVCQEDKRDEVAKSIIRQTMWGRKQLLKNNCLERDRPTRWSRSPIKLKAQYERVYLTTPGLLDESLETIWAENEYIETLCADGTKTKGSQQGDIEIWPRRLFVNPATDLLKYVYFFSSVKGQINLFKNEDVYVTPINYEIYVQPRDQVILAMYPEIILSEEVEVYLYQSAEDAEND